MDKDKKVELKVINVSSNQAQEPAFAMLMQEKHGKRQLLIIIGPAEAQSISFKLNDIRPIRPLTHDLFTSTLSVLEIGVSEIVIYKAIDGVFYSHIFYKRDVELFRVDARPSDAIALALRFNAPIYVYESVLEKECISIGELLETEDTPGDRFASKSVRSLKKELNEAIKEENYELASILRDEIARRE